MLKSFKYVGDRLGFMAPSQNCPECGGSLQLIGEERKVFDPDPSNMTEGEMAEQMAAQMGGAFEEGIHGSTISIFSCEECGETQMEENQ